MDPGGGLRSPCSPSADESASWGREGAAGRRSGQRSAVSQPQPFDPSRPIGPHNLLPTSAIVQLRDAGAGPGVTYSPADYSSPGVSALVSKGTGSTPPTGNPSDVSTSTIVRAG